MKLLSTTEPRFLCQACNRYHRESVGKDQLQVHSSGKVVHFDICSQARFKYNVSLSKSYTNEAANIKSLVALKAKIYKAEQSHKCTLKLRVAFATLVYESALYNRLTRYELFDDHGIGQRCLDSCFEMGDGDEVVHAIMSNAKKNFWLKVQLVNFSGEVMPHWEATYAKVENKRQVSKTQANNQIALAI